MNKDIVCEIVIAMEKNRLGCERECCFSTGSGKLYGEGTALGRHLKEVREQAVEIPENRGD